jgi:probable F420-dependent oxidoreductase
MSGLRCFRRITRFHRKTLPWRRRREVTSHCGCRSTVTFRPVANRRGPAALSCRSTITKATIRLSLAAAAAVTKTIKLATGICLVVERDPIHTAKEVSTIDRLSSGRFIFGVGGGWNEEEMANHGTAFATRFKLMRERIQAMKQIWTQSTAAFDGEFVKFEPMMQWPKPVQKPHPPIVVGGAFPHAARRAIAYGDGWIPIGGRVLDPLEVLPQFRQMARDAGRDPASLSFDVFGAPRDLEVLKRYRDAGVDRVVLMLPTKPRDAILPMLDEGAALVTAL